MTMEQEAELERIRLFTAAARQRIRRLDILLDEQVRILDLDPSLASHSRASQPGQLITRIELQVFAATFAAAALAAFLAGYWIARLN